MTNSELTLDFVHREMINARKLGKKLTDIVLGKHEMEIIKNWAYTSFPSSQKNIFTEEKIKDMMGGSPRSEIFGINIHEINKDSYWETFNLDYDSYPIAKAWDEDDEEIIKSERKMLKLIKENELISQ